MADDTGPMLLGWVIVYVDDPPAAREFDMRAFGLQGGFVAGSGTYAEIDTGATKLAFAAYSLGEANFPGRPDRRALCERRGVRRFVARPRGTLWVREFQTDRTPTGMLGRRGNAGRADGFFPSPSYFSRELEPRGEASLEAGHARHRTCPTLARRVK